MNDTFHCNYVKFEKNLLHIFVIKNSNCKRKSGSNVSKLKELRSI